MSRAKDADTYDEGCVTSPKTYSSERDPSEREGPTFTRGPMATRARSRASTRTNATSDEEKKKFEEEITQINNDLYEAGKTLAAAARALETREKLVADAIDTLDECVAYDGPS